MTNYLTWKNKKINITEKELKDILSFGEHRNYLNAIKLVQKEVNYNLFAAKRLVDKFKLKHNI